MNAALPRQPLIKICGISTRATLEAAIEAGATHIGLVHFEPSPRHLSLEEARALAALARGRAKSVLLTVNADPQSTGEALDKVRPDAIQFHGSETPEWCALVREKTDVEVWRAIGLRDAETLEKCARYTGKVDRLLFDAPPPGNSRLPGGNGESFRWELLRGHLHHSAWGLAGGLTAHNVAEAIRQTAAPLVDTSSGVESAKGIKDVDLIRAFCQAALDA